MGHGSSNFREADLRRAMRVIEAAGKKITAVEIEDGRLIRLKIKIGNGTDGDDINIETSDDLRKLI
ncbi:hypothetical protein [Bradyrhizobium sp. F1.13.3]|uniref:hypothetical protein n=1 Tax=Bradyrhizobium sp. F1.13.3 TaxID=3156351 RepID=UPI003398EF25